MRGDAQQSSPFAARLEHEMQMPMLQITHATVHQARRSAGSPIAEVAAIEESDLHSAQRGIARDAGPGDAAANDDQIEWLFCSARPRGRAPRRREPDA